MRLIMPLLAAGLLAGCAGIDRARQEAAAPAALAERVSFLIVPPPRQFTPDEELWFDEFRNGLITWAQMEGLTLIDYKPLLNYWRALGIEEITTIESLQRAAAVIGAAYVVRLENITTPLVPGLAGSGLTLRLHVISASDGSTLFYDRLSSNDHPLSRLGVDRVGLVSLNLDRGGTLPESSWAETPENVLARIISTRLATILR